MSTPSAERKCCIFCRSDDKLTDEHIWGDWTRTYIPRPHKKHDFADVRVPKPGVHELAQTRIRAGDPLNSQVRVVCGKCNSGWMSQIQETAKPHLIPLFKGEFRELSKIAQTAIAAWIAMATMTAEHLARKPDNIVTSQRERKWLMKKRTAPTTWRIWIGKYLRKKWPGQWIRVTLPILEAEDIPKAEAANRRTPNVQTTAFVVGELYVFAMNGAYPTITNLWDWRTDRRAINRLVQIWPVIADPVPWGLVDMSDDEAASFATAFKRYSDDLAARVGFH
jgi:hypothetical protein